MPGHEAGSVPGGWAPKSSSYSSSDVSSSIVLCNVKPRPPVRSPVSVLGPTRSWGLTKPLEDDEYEDEKEVPRS